MDDDHVLSSWNWLGSAEISVNIDLSKYGSCANRMPEGFGIDAVCQLPDVESIHITYGGHIGMDQDSFMWSWDENSARMIVENNDYE